MTQAQFREMLENLLLGWEIEVLTPTMGWQAFRIAPRGGYFERDTVKYGWRACPLGNNSATDWRRRDMGQKHA